MQRAIGTGISVLAATAASFALLAPAAFGGSYVVRTCSPSASPSMWTPVNTFPAAFGVGNHCGGPPIGPLDGSHDGALYAEDVRTQSTSIPNGSRAGWLLAAPDGTTITAISLYRRLAAAGDPDLVAGLYQGDGVALEECKVPWPMQAAGDAVCAKPNLQAPVRFADLDTDALFLGVGCRIVRAVPACGMTNTQRPAVQADLYSAEITLAEDTPPSISDVSGALWNGGVVSGVVPVTFTASDATGIKEQSVRRNGNESLISVQQACDFSVAQPCPQQPLGSLDVDTTRVPDGPQTFSLAVTDAADNTRIVMSPPVVVDNHGPPPPVGLTATAEGVNAIVLNWGNPANPPAPVARAMVQVCQATCPAAIGAGTSGATRVAVPGPGLYSVRMWLLDALGRGGPHNAALASVRIAPPVTASPPTATTTDKLRTKIAAVLRGRTLRVTGTLARSGRVRVGWQSLRAGRRLGSGSRMVSIRDHAIAATFTLPMRARARGAIIRVAIRSAGRIVAQTRARRG
jgi:hypothetical protein